MKDANECDELPDVLWLGHDVVRSDFELRFERIETLADGWTRFGVCRTCGQPWRLDFEDRLQVCLAIKVPRDRPWSDADDHRARFGYLVTSFGGEGTEMCRWAGCPNHALQGVALCGVHLWQNGTRARGG